MLQKHISQYTDQELETLIEDLVSNKEPESMTLEYKAEQSFNPRARLEIAKDISSFANTKGGTIIYGIPEERKVDGAEETAIPASEYGIEPIGDFAIRLENALTELLSPHLPDLWVRKIPLSRFPGKVVYVVWHPESWLGPHMVQAAAGEYSYNRRGLRRTHKMTEPEIREAYARVQRLVGLAERFLDSREVGYIAEFFPDSASVSQIVSCPHLLVPDRVDYASEGMKEWLRKNPFPQENLSPDGSSSVSWYPSIWGVQAGMKHMAVAQTAGQRELFYWIELHRNGAVNVLWQTHISRQNEPHFLYWQKELTIVRDFLNFDKVFYEKIRYFGPIRFRLSISNLASVELRSSKIAGSPFAAQLPDNCFSAEIVEDSGHLLENPNAIHKFFGNRLFQAYGVWESPGL